MSLQTTSRDDDLDRKEKDLPTYLDGPAAKGDAAMQIARITEATEIDEKANRKLLRKIDWHLMPLLCLVYGLQFVGTCRDALLIAITPFR
jgi:ACS family allantoate permease-like MFS transporter